MEAEGGGLEGDGVDPDVAQAVQASALTAEASPCAVRMQKAIGSAAEGVQALREGHAKGLAMATELQRMMASIEALHAPLGDSMAGCAVCKRHATHCFIHGGVRVHGGGEGGGGQPTAGGQPAAAARGGLRLRL